MCRHLFAEYESNRWTNRPCRTRRRSIFSSHKASRSNALQQRGTSECWQFVWDCHIHQTNPNRADQSVDFKCPQCGRVKRRNSLYCCVSKWQDYFKRSEKNITTDTFLSHFCCEMESEDKSGFVIYSGCWKRWRLITHQNTKQQGLHLSGRRLMVTPRWAKTSQKDVFSTLTAEFAGFKLRVLQCNFSQKHLKNVLWFKIKSFRKTTLHSMQQKLQTGLETVVSNIYFFIDTFQISKTNWRHSVKGAWCTGAEHCSSGSPVCNRLAYLK